MIFTYTLRACRKTPTIKLGMHSDVRRTYPICISIGACVVSTSRKIMREVLATAHDLYVPAELSSDTYV